MDTTQILIEEKKLIFAEKLQLIRTIKQSLAFLGTITTLLFGGALQYKVEEIYVALPFIVNILGYFLMTNINMFNLICEFIRMIDTRIAREHKEVLLWEGQAGGEMAKWGFNITKDKGYVTLSPYYLFSIFTSFLVLSIYFTSTVKGCYYLQDHFNRYVALSYLILCFGAIVLFIVVGLMFLRNHNRMRNDLLKMLS